MQDIIFPSLGKELRDEADILQSLCIFYALHCLSGRERTLVLKEYPHISVEFQLSSKKSELYSLALAKRGCQNKSLRGEQ